MDVTQAAAASITAVGGYFALGALIRAARWIAGKTKNKTDDRVLDRLQELVTENPEILELLEHLLKRR